MSDKKKLTLSIREDLLEEAKRLAMEQGTSLSRFFEECLEHLTTTQWLDDLARELSLDPLDSTTPDEIPKTRPQGLDSAQLLRELRKEREARLLNDR